MATKGNTTWDRMTDDQRVTACKIDIMGHKEFALLSGVVCVGTVKYMLEMPTAATNGRDVLLGTEFMRLQGRKQFRWVLLHENFHKALRHCTNYKDVVEKHSMLCNIAQDFVINAIIDDMDPQQDFAERPVGADGKPLDIAFDRKYSGWSWLEVLRDLLKNAKPIQVGVGGGGTLKGQAIKMPNGGTYYVFDEHIPGEGDMTPEELKEAERQIDDAVRQGKIIADKLAGNEKGGRTLDGLVQERNTNWREPLRRFVEETCEGDEQSRYCPPNKRMLASGFVMPSHFSESTGELHIYCDTSGSMGGVYPVVFGEIANICKTVRPKLVRVFWWDTVCYEPQTFTPDTFDKIAHLLKPEGGGGTHPQCVVDYVADKDYKPKCGIWLTDGYLDGSNTGMAWPVLWGVVDNDSFVPPSGKVLHIDSMAG